MNHVPLSYIVDISHKYYTFWIDSHCRYLQMKHSQYIYIYILSYMNHIPLSYPHHLLMGRLWQRHRLDPKNRGRQLLLSLGWEQCRPQKVRNDIMYVYTLSLCILYILYMYNLYVYIYMVSLKILC